jgi:hypothetical protein
MTMKKLIAIVALTASVMATPALAQSFDPDVGTGNVLSFRNDQTAQQNDKIAARHRGLDAFAKVPWTSSAAESAADSYAPGVY